MVKEILKEIGLRLAIGFAKVLKEFLRRINRNYDRLWQRQRAKLIDKYLEPVVVDAKELKEHPECYIEVSPLLEECCPTDTRIVRAAIAETAWGDLYLRIFSVASPGHHQEIVVFIEYSDDILYPAKYSYRQGFLTNKGEFVSRTEAAKIAKAADQVDKDFDKEKLFSEDLWNLTEDYAPFTHHYRTSYFVKLMNMFYSVEHCLQTLISRLTQRLDSIHG